MKKFAYLALSGTALLLTLTACPKDKDPTPTPTPPSRTDYLTSHNWKVSSATVTATVLGQSSSQNIFDKPCELDDIYTFRTDKTMVEDEGATKCDPSDPKQETGTWAFSNGEQKLAITSAGQSLFVFAPDADIKELSATTLHVTGTGPYVDPTTGISVQCTVDFTFVAQ